MRLSTMFLFFLFAIPAIGFGAAIQQTIQASAGDNTFVTEATDFEGDARITFGTVDMGADEFHTHFYCTGDFTSAGAIEGKFVGVPDAAPICLFIGTSLLDPPLQHKWGVFHVGAPWYLIPLGIAMPSEGVIVIPATLPGTCPDYFAMQALIGWELSNLFVLDVE